MSITILGIVGAGLVLLAFILEQYHVWKDDDLSYDLQSRRCQSANSLWSHY